MVKRFCLALFSVVALVASGWLIVAQLAESGEHPADKIQRVLDEDAAKPTFSGRLGDFLILQFVNGEVPDQAKLSRCASTPVPLSDSLRNEELWSPGFKDGATGWACPGQGVVGVNNEGEGREAAKGILLGRRYIWSR